MVEKLANLILFKPKGPMPTHSDNQFSIYTGKNLVFHDHTKHIEIDSHLLRDAMMTEICTLFTSLSKQPTDILHKKLHH